jgi:hypothetical protein
LTVSRDTFRGMLVKIDLTERDLREWPEERILRRAREALTRWELASFADEMKRRRHDAA